MRGEMKILGLAYRASYRARIEYSCFIGAPIEFRVSAMIFAVSISVDFPNPTNVALALHSYNADVHVP